jgi:hypothetical protein
MISIIQNSRIQYLIVLSMSNGSCLYVVAILLEIEFESLMCACSCYFTV